MILCILNYQYEVKKLQKLSIFRKILSFFGFILFAVFSVALILNITIITKGIIDPSMPPSILGITPLVVQSGSMSGTQDGHIEMGDLIFSEKIDPDSLQVGDVISYMQGSVVVTHRIVERNLKKSGETVFITKGDLNNSPDKTEVTYDKIVGKYKTRIAKVGDIAMFLQTPIGMGIFAGIPLCLFVLYDIIKNYMYKKKEKKKSAELEKELKILREKEEIKNEITQQQ